MVAGEREGEVFESDSSLDSGSRGVFLLSSLVLPTSTVVGFEAWCVRTSPARLQIWRPLYPDEPDERTFRLVGEVKAQARRVPSACKVCKECVNNLVLQTVVQH